MPNKTNYTVTVKTGTRDGAGTDAKVSIDVFGNLDKFTDEPLVNTKIKDPFEAGALETFTLNDEPDVGELDYIIIRHDNSGKKAGWFLDYVIIQNTKNNKSWKFYANRWLATDEEDHRTYVKLYPERDYDISIYTADVDGAGTDADIFITLQGSMKKSEEELLDNTSKNDFERGQTDVFSIHTTDVGDIKSITLRMSEDNDSDSPWYVDGAKVVCRNTNKVTYFPASYKSGGKDYSARRLSSKNSITLYPGNEMAHYTYIGQSPANCTNTLSTQLNGVSHAKVDGKHFWFFAQNEQILKIPAEQDLSKVQRTSTGVSTGTLGGHLGDIDCDNNYLFVPIEKDNHVRISVLPTNNLKTVITSQDMQYNNGNVSRKMETIGWVAINPNDHLLFTSDRGDNNNPILVYKIDYSAISAKKTNFLTQFATLYVKDEFGNSVNRGSLQGGCFDNSNHLHLVNGSTRRVLVYDIPSLKQGDSVSISCRTNSNQTHDFRVQCSSSGEYLSGITYWDLSASGSPRIPNISEQLHVIMTALSRTNLDEKWYFKHYRKL